MSYSKKSIIRKLKTTFGFNDFRPNQYEAVEALLKGKDVFTMMATGSGKSICYQLPSLITNGVTIVVSPLISLMEDQVQALTNLNIPATFLGSAQTNPHIRSKILQNNYRIVYMTPEFVSTDTDFIIDIRDATGNITAIAIDESHCISEWGHDFRASYRQLKRLRSTKELSDIPIIALTATATKKVATDIITNLQLKDPLKIQTTFNRPNLTYIIQPQQSRLIDIENLVSKGHLEKPTIIYTLTKKETESISKFITRTFDIPTLPYHAGLPIDERKHAHMSFITDKIKCIVATVAFGMGIDKPDIRTIVHYGIPKNLESYYQQTGRAGRDGNPSTCYLLYAAKDFTMTEFYLKNITNASQRYEANKRITAMQKFVRSSECRRKLILKYFDEDTSKLKCDKCDTCFIKSGKTSSEKRDLTEEVTLLLRVIYQTGQRFGYTIPIDVLAGSKNQKVTVNGFDRLPTHGKGRHHAKEWWKALVFTLLGMKGIIKEDNSSQYKCISIGKQGIAILTKGSSVPKITITPILQNAYKKELKLKSAKAPKAPSASFFSTFKTPASPTSKEDEDMEKAARVLVPMKQTLIKLQEWRDKRADEDSVAPYMILQDHMLETLAKERPQSLDKLLLQSGISASKAIKYGEDLLEILKNPTPSTSPTVSTHSPKTPSPKKKASRKSAKSAPLKISLSLVNTYKAYQATQNIKEIAEQRKIQKPTVENHLAKLIELNDPKYKVDLFKYMSRLEYETIRTEVEKTPNGKLKDIRDRLPIKGVTYFQVKLVRGRVKQLRQ